METVQNLDNVVLTDGIKKLILKSDKFTVFITECLEKHINHDWGNTPDEDKEINEQFPDEAMSTYVYEDNQKNITVWVKSENGNIIILLPCEY